MVLEVGMLGMGGGGGAEEQKGEEGQVERRSRHGCSAVGKGKAAAAETVGVYMVRAESAVHDMYFAFASVAAIGLFVGNAK
jgi:hypothetical protein